MKPNSEEPQTNMPHDGVFRPTVQTSGNDDGLSQPVSDTSNTLYTGSAAQKPAMPSFDTWTEANNLQSEPETTPNSASNDKSIPHDPGKFFVADSAQYSASANGFNAGKKSTKKKRVLLIVALLVLLLSLGAAAYFFYYVPNQPENVWKKSLQNTADGLEQLASVQMEEEGKGLIYTGSYKLEAPEVSEGTLSGRYDKDGNLSFEAEFGVNGNKAEFDVRNQVSPGLLYGDSYFRLGGLTPILNSLYPDMAGDFSSILEQIDGQWFSVSDTEVGELLGPEAVEETPELSPEDVQDISNRIMTVNREYVFTDDPQKAVLKPVENIGKEDYEGVSSYKYRVEVDKNNLKAYMTAMKDSLKESKLNELVPEGETMEESVEFESLLRSIDDTDFSKVRIEMWADMRYKLLRNIRLAPTDLEAGAEGYLDASVLYDRSDVLPLRIKLMYKDDEGNLESIFTLNIDQKTNEVKALFSINGNAPETEIKVSGEMTITPSDDPVEVEVPSDARSFIEFIESMFGELPGMVPETALSGNADEERKIAINALYAQLEVFYNDNGYYPSLEQLNDASWRAMNLIGLDANATMSPSGNSVIVGGQPTLSNYAYNPTATDAGECDNDTRPCTSFTLSALLEANSELFVKRSLNQGV